MKLKVTLRLSTWIRLQQKIYGVNLWFIKTPEGRVGFSKKPFDIQYLQRKYWDRKLEDYKGNHYENLQAPEYTVSSRIGETMPIEPGTQIHAKDLINKIRMIEEEY